MYGKHVCMLTAAPKVSSRRPLASRWRRLCSDTRYLLLPSAWHYASKQFLRSQKALENECSRQMNAPACFIIHPYSIFKFYWDCYATLVYTAALIYMPFQVFSSCPNRYDLFILYNDVIATATIVIRFFTGSIDNDGKYVILDLRQIAQRYLKDTFVFDVLAALPFQFISLFENCEYPTHTVFFLLKLLRLVTVRNVWKSISNQVGISYLGMMAVTVLYRTVFFFHWMAFCHYQVPVVFAHIYDHEGRFLKWLNRYRVSTASNTTMAILDKYISNLYYVSGICMGAGVYRPSGVNGQMSAEQLLTAIMGIIGLLFMVYFFTTLLRLIVYRHYENYLYNGRLKELQEYLTFTKVPKGLQQKIQLYINYRFNGHYFNEKSILNTINVQIKQEINMFCCKKLVTNVPLFQDMPVAFINMIIFSLTRVLYMPGEIVVRYGHPGSSIYLLSSGTVAIMNAEGKEVGHLKDGAFFGERALLRPGTLRAATIVALEITEMYKLHNTQFQACLQPCPRLKRRLEEAVLNMNMYPPPPASPPPHSSASQQSSSTMSDDNDSNIQQ